MAAKSLVMEDASSPPVDAPPVSLLLDAELDSVLLDSVEDAELCELSLGALLELEDWLDGVDSLELAAPVLLPHDAMTRLTEKSAATIADFLPTNIRSPFLFMVTPPEGVG